MIQFQSLPHLVKTTVIEEANYLRAKINEHIKTVTMSF